MATCNAIGSKRFAVSVVEVLKPSQVVPDDGLAIGPGVGEGLAVVGEDGIGVRSAGD